VSFLAFYLTKMVDPEHLERVRQVLATDPERAKQLASPALLAAIEETARAVSTAPSQPPSGDTA
jgi:hypothetical protein